MKVIYFKKILKESKEINGLYYLDMQDLICSSKHIFGNLSSSTEDANLYCISSYIFTVFQTHFIG